LQSHEAEHIVEAGEVTQVSVVPTGEEVESYLVISMEN